MGFRNDWKDGWSGFAARVFIEFPVKNWREFLEIKKRCDPKDPRRYLKNWGELVRAYRRRDFPLGATIRSPFWWTRDMIGLKGIKRGLDKAFLGYLSVFNGMSTLLWMHDMCLIVFGNFM